MIKKTSLITLGVMEKIARNVMGIGAATIGSALIYRALFYRRRPTDTPAAISKVAKSSDASVCGAITFVYSRHFEESRRFYEEDLDLPVRCDKGAVVFYALGRSTSLGVVREGVSAAESPPCSARTASRDTVMLCLLTSQVNSCFNRLMARQRCTVVQPPQVNEKFGIFNALVRDPDGYLVELQQFLDASEQERFTGATTQTTSGMRQWQTGRSDGVRRLGPGKKSTATDAVIGALRASDREQWERLYRGYIDFYKRHEPQSFYDQNWARLLEGSTVRALVARSSTDETMLLGLAHFVRHPSMSGDVCYLQDLFTDPLARGKGLGTLLINAVVSWCQATDGEVSKVYWNTHETNPARDKLYDVVGIHNGFVKYHIDV